MVGADQVDRAPDPVMGAEDFAFMLEQRPGSYVFIGNGGGDDAPMVHHPEYDFNDEALPYGASYWASWSSRSCPPADRRRGQPVAGSEIARADVDRRLIGASGRATLTARASRGAKP